MLASMQLQTSTVVTNKAVATGYFELEADWSGPAPEPGQFVTVRIGDSTEPLLRRPFAVSALLSEGGASRFRMIYQMRGKTTGLLAALRPDDTIDVLGPLGRPFPLPRKGAVPILVAGGIGIGPVLFLADRLMSFEDDAHRPPVLVCGARTAELLPRSSLERSSAELLICTDDGSDGIEGTVIDGIDSIDSRRREMAEYYACGPMAMMAGVAAQAESEERPCWVSLEQVMGCGVGACMGCAVRVHSQDHPFERVCTEGPVFDARHIVW